MEQETNQLTHWQTCQTCQFYDTCDLPKLQTDLRGVRVFKDTLEEAAWRAEREQKSRSKTAE